MIRVNLSDGTLLTLVIPGAILLIAISLVLWPHLWPAVDVVLNALEIIRKEKSLDTAVLFAALLAVGVLIAYVMALLVGALIAVAVGYIEFRVLDVWAAKELSITSESYAAEWSRYVDHLDDISNSYVSKMVESFMFEFRTGLATLLSGLLLLFTTFSVWWTVAIVIIGILLLKAGTDDHSGLADYRHRRFAEDSEFRYDSEESIKKIVTRWCKREEFEPLRLLLPTWPLVEGKNDGVAKLIEALEAVRRLPPAKVHPAEAEFAGRAIATLRERARGAAA